MATMMTCDAGERDHCPVSWPSDICNDAWMLSVSATKLALAGLTVIGAAFFGAASALADPDPGAPAPVDPGAPAPIDPGAPPAPAPVGLPTVPEMQNPVYGSGQYGSGPLGAIRDLWHQAQDPYYSTDDPGQLPRSSAPPPGAGPAPALPPGYVSINAPGSETVAPETGPATGGPALPPGYYPIDGPPPPGYEYQDPRAPQPQTSAPGFPLP